MGELRYIWNVGSQDITLKHEDINSTAANRFLSSTGDLTVPPNRCVFAMYDNTSQRWRVTLI